MPAKRPERARFDATMVLDAERNTIVDYLGSHQHLATDLSLEVTDEGGLTIRSHEQRFYEGSGRFEIRGVRDEQALRPLFGYRGSFACTWPEIGLEGVPAALLPLREESRR